MALAEELRPKLIKDIVGQKHLVGDKSILSNILSTKDEYFPDSIILYGPPGIGKTSIAECLCNELGYNFVKLNATTAKTADIQEAIKEKDTIQSANGFIIFIDEVHRLQRSTQQILLEYVERGKVKLIAGTTENPYHAIQKGLISRSIIMELKPLSSKDIKEVLLKGIDKLNESDYLNLTVEEDALEYLSTLSNGDVRNALNTLELVAYGTYPESDGNTLVTVDSINNLSFSKLMRMDKDGDEHYDLLSAFQKSIRGSDIDAAIHYLARLMSGGQGNLEIICRRLSIMACEDVSLAYPNAVAIVKSCVDIAKEVGFPEARIPLAQAVVLLASAPKSNSSYMAINKAVSDMEHKYISEIPLHLKDAHYDGAFKMGRGCEYLYPHNYPNSYVEQQYMPDSLKDTIYYVPGNNKTEYGIKEHMNRLKGNKCK